MADEKAPIVPQPPPGRPAKSGGEKTVTIGFVLAIISLVLAWVPFAGYLGVIALLVALLGRANTPEPKPGAGITIASVIMGLVGVAAAVAWTYIAATASCPHVYAWDGQEYRLDADMLSGSLFKAGESEDVDRLEYLKESQGRYLVRIANERQERDFVDRAALLVVDHPAAATALPGQAGEIELLQGLQAPLAARDAKGRDQLAALEGEDGGSWQGLLEDHDADAESEPREVLEVTLPRPQGSGPAFLVLRARNTEAGTEALYQYLARIGPGLGSLLRWSQESHSYPYQRRLADEMDRLGIPLRIEALGPEGWRPVQKLKPVGPGALRYQAVPIDLPSGDSIKVRLIATPLAWEIDRVAIATAMAAPAVQVLAPARAIDETGADVVAHLASADGDRVMLENGRRLDLTFTAPPPPAEGLTRSVFMSMRGYYEVDIGGRGWLNPVAIYQHRSGSDSAPRFYLRSLREKAGR
jgi:hypothetical protein